MLAPAGVSAASYENIGGVAGYSVYFSERTIVDPATAGPAVVFYQYITGRVELGAHNCHRTLYAYNYMQQYTWRAVWDTQVANTVFCLWTNAAPAGWNGNLGWD